MNKNTHITRSEYASWILAALAMLFSLRLHLLPALIAGLLVYELVHVLAPLFARHTTTRRAKAAAIVVVSLFVVGIVSAASFGIVVFMKGEGGSLSALLAKMADIIEDSRSTLPAWVVEFLPSNAQGVRDTLSQWLREHASELQSIGKDTGHALAQVLIGMVIGAMVSLRDALQVYLRGQNKCAANILDETDPQPQKRPVRERWGDISCLGAAIEAHDGRIRPVFE